MPDEALTAQQLDAIRTLLEKRRQELQAQSNQLDETTRPVSLDQQAVGRVSRIDAIQQQQMAIANRAQAERQLTGIELALARIEDGDYGHCRQCGEAIPFARLEVQPFAILCIDCQSANEND